MTKKPDETVEDINVDELLKDILAATDSLSLSIGVCEETRQFMAVARLAVRNNNNELAESILSVMIDRIDPFLQNLYVDIKDSELVEIVTEKMADPKLFDESQVEFVELDETEIDTLFNNQGETDG